VQTGNSVARFFVSDALVRGLIHRSDAPVLDHGRAVDATDDAMMGEPTERMLLNKYLR